MGQGVAATLRRRARHHIVSASVMSQAAACAAGTGRIGPPRGLPRKLVAGRLCTGPLLANRPAAEQAHADGDGPLQIPVARSILASCSMTTGRVAASARSAARRQASTSSRPLGALANCSTVAASLDPSTAERTCRCR